MLSATLITLFTFSMVKANNHFWPFLNGIFRCLKVLWPISASTQIKIQKSVKHDF